MDREVIVYVDLDGTPHLAGRLWSRARKDRESATFEYDRAWLEHPARFALEPALTLGPGPFHTAGDTPMFGAIGDSAPDRWGRVLMRRIERRRAAREGQTPRTLHEIDFLVLVDDEARQGALRFAEREGGPFLREEGGTRIPPRLELARLLSATERLLDDKDTDEDLRLLMVFNILISNTDDHLRNHGFLYEGRDGWRLSPAYDLNPVPADVKPRMLSTAINEDDHTASLPLALGVAAYFELDTGRARDIAAQVGTAVSRWREVASQHGLSPSEADRMASAFEHGDLEMARAF